MAEMPKITILIFSKYAPNAVNAPIPNVAPIIGNAQQSPQATIPSQPVVLNHFLVFIFYFLIIPNSVNPFFNSVLIAFEPNILR